MSKSWKNIGTILRSNVLTKRQTDRNTSMANTYMSQCDV